MQDRFVDWLRSFSPAPVNASPREWLRAALGVSLGMLLVVYVELWLFGQSVTLHMVAPVGASAVLLMAAPSSPFAQPWSLLAGNLLATLIGVSVAQAQVHAGWAVVLAACLTLGLGYLLRCLHPPSCALAMLAAVGGEGIGTLGYGLLAPVLFASGLLLAVALLYNNLTGHAYPKPRILRDSPHETGDPLPQERHRFNQDDMARALEEFGEYVDVTPEGLERLMLITQKYALRRSMGEVSAADVMSRDLHRGTPQTPIEQAWRTLQRYRLHALPVVDAANGRLLGIVTLSDLIRHFHPGRGRIRFGALRYRKGLRLADIMTSPVVTATPDTHMVELVNLLSDRGLHCLPVVEGDGTLVGLITQTDLIAALYGHWLRQLPD
ncbi:HPP family protein [Stutzerimonas azotifigens]|uniref:HPP family protein n=1 Tax=Stutzerimonas azotifigens TaxID=291995 RepID=UPI0004896E45|nr:CBS domain-containing protein [Stutzerimonas azotifigens]